MTHYTRSYEEQRNDRALKDLIFRELKAEQKLYAESAELLQKVYDNSAINRVEVYRLLKKAVWERDFLKAVIDKYPTDDTYIGNKAAFMTEDEIKALKEKYDGDAVESQ